MITAVLFYRFYASVWMRILRFAIASLLLVYSVLQLTSGTFPHIALFLLVWFLIFEIFFRFSLAHIRPKKTIMQVTPEILTDSVTMPILLALSAQHSWEKVIEQLSHLPQVRFISRKCAILRKDLQFIPVAEQEVLTKGYELAKARNGTYITSMDIFAAYLLVTESQTKLLFQKEIKPHALETILVWAHIHFPDEEHPPKNRVSYTQSGIGEGLVTGWTPETQKYTADMTYEALSKKPLLAGREQTLEAMITTLTKTEHNNILLVGESGSGKETLVKTLGFFSFVGMLPRGLNGKKLLELRVGQILAGAANRSEIEARLEAIIQEVSHAGNIIVFIPDFQNIVGASSFGVDLSGTLLPYLRSGALPIIGSMTKGNYKTYVEKNPIQETMTVITLEEPEKDVCMQMLFHKTDAIEATYNCIITYQAIVAAVTLANRYMPDTVLPGSAVRLLEDAAHAVAQSAQTRFFGTSGKKLVTKDGIVQTVEQHIHTPVAAPQAEEKSLLLHLEEKLHERVIGQSEAIRLISEAMRRIRTGLSASQRPISFLFLGPTGVGKTETAKALAALYYGGEQHMLRFDMSEYGSEDGVKRLLGSAPGQGEERGELTDRIHDNPNALVLLDEFEKAHPSILNLFLQVFDDGRLTDNKGQTVSFANCIIIATSNAGSEFIREQVKNGAVINDTFEKQLLEELQKNHLFKPELLNRFDDVVTFKPLATDEIEQITKLLLLKLAQKLLEKDITVHYDEKLVQKIMTEGFEEDFGARPLQRYIQNTVEEFLAQKMLRDEIQRGSTITISVNEQHELTIAS